MSKIKLLFYIITLVFIYSHNTIAQTQNTNIDGLVIKDFGCSIYGNITGNIVNRTSQNINKTIFIKVFDSDLDPIGSCEKPLNLEASSGKRIVVSSCNCFDGKSYKVIAR